MRAGYIAIREPAVSVLSGMGEVPMAERLNQFARLHEVVPVESWRKNGVDGWLFRDRRNRLLFVPSVKLLGSDREEAVLTIGEPVLCG